MSQTDKKEVIFVGSSQRDLSDFPRDAKAVAGHQLWLIEQGLLPTLSKPMPEVGPGVAEITIDTGDAFRVFYVAKFTGRIYVLHAFNKKTRKTSHHDMQIGRRNYKALVAERSRMNAKGRKDGGKR